MDLIQKELLEEIADLHGVPAGAYNIRANGAAAARNTTANIDIVSKEDKPGIDIIIKPGPKKESVHIPVVISIHEFFVGKNSKIRYVEKHYGNGDGKGGKVMNPKTIIHLDENAYFYMDTVQIKGIDSTMRETEADLKDGAKLEISEKLMTHGEQKAETQFAVDLDGEGSSANVVSRSVARNDSYQMFRAKISGNNACAGHSECDAIIMDNARVCAIPELEANNLDAELIHEAAIGKIAGEQLIKLMTLGLTEEEAEEMIISGFLK